MENKSNRGSIVLGTILLAAGIMTLLGQIVGGSGIWPFFIIAFGLAFFAGMALGGRSMGALAIPGATITGVGVILLLQNTFQMWETWSYAWALIISAVGIGLAIAGWWGKQPDMVRSGWHAIRVGFVLFMVFGIIFELIMVITGVRSPTGGIFWPVMLILAGIGQIILRSYRLFRGGEIDHNTDVNLFGPVLNIGFGLLWLQVNMGSLTWTQLSVLLNLWPLLLIAGGINIIIGRKMQWVNLALGMLVVVGMFYVVYNGQSLGLRARAPWNVLGISINNDQGPVTKWVSGSGPMKTETVEVGDFSEVNMMLSGDMEIIQGAKPALLIEAEEDLLPYIVAEVKNGELEIRSKPGVAITSIKGIHYTLTVKELKAFTLSGAGTITGESLDTDELDITINGYGNITLNNLALTELDAKINGSGSVNVTGSADTVTARINGAGSINAPDLEAQNASVVVSGIGGATLWVKDELSTRFFGAGNVSYYGDPNLRQETTGIGNVRRLGSK